MMQQRPPVGGSLMGAPKAPPGSAQTPPPGAMRTPQPTQQQAAFMNNFNAKMAANRMGGGAPGGPPGMPPEMAQQRAFAGGGFGGGGFRPMPGAVGGSMFGGSMGASPMAGRLSGMLRSDAAAAQPPQMSPFQHDDAPPQQMPMRRPQPPGTPMAAQQLPFQHGA